MNWSAPHYTRVDIQAMSGMALIVTGMLSYSLVGVGYEYLVNGMPLERPLSQAQVRFQAACL